MSNNACLFSTQCILQIQDVRLAEGSLGKGVTGQTKGVTPI